MKQLDQFLQEIDTLVVAVPQTPDTIDMIGQEGTVREELLIDSEINTFRFRLDQKPEKLVADPDVLLLFREL